MQAAQNPNSSSNLSGFAFDSSALGNSAPAPAAAVDGSVGASATAEIPEKKKRGRPKKVLAEGGSIANAASGSGAKKSRGRPAGSVNKKHDALGADDARLTPHLIFVGAGEDISYKVMSFAQQLPRVVFILSATGSICNATLRPAAMSGGNVTYEGQYEILTLDGSFRPLENGSRAGALKVSLAGSDGKVVGGNVAGMLVAASPIQMIVGSYFPEIKKQKAKLPSAAPSSNILNFSAPASGVANSPSQGASNESSEENHVSPLDHGQRPYINAGQPMQNMSMYSPMSWTNNSKMPPN